MKGLQYTPLDWCNALTSSNLVHLQLLCEIPEARECVNDRWLVPLDPLGGAVEKIPSPLMYAISKDVPLGRIQLLVDHGGAQVTTKSLHCLLNHRTTERGTLFLFLLSRGAQHDYYTFRAHLECLSSDEQKVALLQRYPAFASLLDQSTQYAHLVTAARQRLASARATATAIVACHRRGGHGPLNKDMLRVIAQMTMQKAASSAWKPPPVPWWKRLWPPPLPSPPPPESVGEFTFIICMGIIAMHGMFCLLTGSSNMQCLEFWPFGGH